MPEVKEHFITFESNGGSHFDALRVKKDEIISKPNNSIRENYNFDGWFVNNETFKEEYTFNSEIINNITLFAKWMEKGYGF